jgi:hypothetical protein
VFLSGPYLSNWIFAKCSITIVTWHQKAGIVEPQQTSVARQQLGKHIPVAMNTHATIDEPVSKRQIGKHTTIGLLFETVVSVRSVQSGYKQEYSWEEFDFRVEAGSNTSTVTLRVVGGDEKGSLESETVKYGQEIQGTRTQKWLRWRGPGAFVKDRPVLSLERVPHINKLATVWQ